MADDNKLLREEETCKTDNSAPLYTISAILHIQILLHTIQPEPAEPFLAAQPEPRTQDLLAPRTQTQRTEACSWRRAIRNVPDSSRSGLVVPAAACRYTVINAAGHEVIFYPKFHCELNYIEYCWGAVKRYTRANCQYSFPELEKILFVAFDSVELGIMRRYTDRSKRWVMAYINGLTVEQREYAESRTNRTGERFSCM